jgi:MFS family permease
VRQFPVSVGESFVLAGHDIAVPRACAATSQVELASSYAAEVIQFMSLRPAGGSNFVTPSTAAVELPLRRNRDFAWLWAGQTVSMAGSAISFIGLPLTSVFVLHVDAIRLGVISAMELLPSIVASPIVGPLADRYSRHRLMLIADVGRFSVFGLLPLLYLTVGLRYWMMPLAAFIVGILTSLFNISFPAFLPSVVSAKQLGSGNARLSASESGAGIVGPGLATALYAAGGVITLVLADAVSYLVSAWSLLQIHQKDPGHGGASPAASRPRLGELFGSYWATVTAGFGLLRADPVLRTVTRSGAIMACFAQTQSAIYFLFLVRGLHFTAVTISVVFVLSGALGLISALACDRLATRFGYGRLIVVGQLVMALGGVFLASAQGPRVVAAACILAGEACFEIGLTLWGVGRQTIFQLRLDDAVRGRVMGAARFITGASTPFAAILAGVIGTVAGLRAAVAIGAVGMVLGMLVVVSPRIWRLSA